MFAIFDVSLVCFSTSVLESSLATASRETRTGQTQAAGMTEAQFRQLVCDRMSALLSCDARLMIDVRRFDNFGGIATPPALDATGKAHCRRRIDRR